MKKAGLATGGLQKAFPPDLPRRTGKQIGRQGESLLACMTANREPSNQSFEVDREATVCLRTVASFCDDRYPALRGGRREQQHRIERRLVHTTGSAQRLRSVDLLPMPQASGSVRQDRQRR
jgi:hypothetical protein